MPTRSQQQQHQPSPTASAERPSPAASRRRPPTTNDTRRPAERVRVTDNPAEGRGRAYLVERELEQDGNAALQALVAELRHALDDGQITLPPTGTIGNFLISGWLASPR